MPAARQRKYQAGYRMGRIVIDIYDHSRKQTVEKYMS